MSEGIVPECAAWEFCGKCPTCLKAPEDSPIVALSKENQALKARIEELTTPEPRCQFASYCTRRPVKGDLCEWHVCSKKDCTKPREKAFHTCEEH
jgi:hypothetical protein